MVVVRERDDPLAADPEPEPSLGRSVRADLRASTWPQRLLLLATVGWIGYEWGFGNETATPWILVRVISSTSGWMSVVAVGFVGFAFTTAQQLLSGHIALAGFSMFDRTAEAAWRKLRTRLDEQPRGWHDLALPARALVVFTLGTTAVVLTQVMVTGRAERRRHIGVVNEAALLCGLMVGAIGAVIAAAAWFGRSVPALEPATEWLIRVLGNPLFWIGLLVVVVAVGVIRRRFASTTASSHRPSPNAGTR